MNDDAWRVLPLVWLFFPVVWLVACGLIASLGGWRTLAESYPAIGEMPGQRFRWRSLSMRRGTHYNGCVNLVASSIGLELRMMWLFRFGHPPLFVPWGEVRVERRRHWMVPVVTLHLARRPEIPLHLPARLAEELVAVSGGALTVPDPSPSP